MQTDKSRLYCLQWRQEMDKTAIGIQISDKSLKEAGIDYKWILDASLEALAHLYDRHNLDYDCGYNPQMITNGTRN